MATKEVQLKTVRSKWRLSKRKLPPKTWPEVFGFSVTSGPIPCYVISVERGSPAHRAGICPGDQIVELDGRNVADMSADNIRALASVSHLNQGSEVNVAEDHPQQLPKLGVVSRVQYLELTAADVRLGYGLSLSGVRPTVVREIDANGPAEKAGVRPGRDQYFDCFDW